MEQYGGVGNFKHLHLKEDGAFVTADAKKAQKVMDGRKVSAITKDLLFQIAATGEISSIDSEKGEFSMKAAEEMMESAEKRWVERSTKSRS